MSTPAAALAARPASVDHLLTEIRDEYIQRNELAERYQAEVNRAEGWTPIGGTDAIRRKRVEIESAARARKAASALIALGNPAVEQIVASLFAFARSTDWHVQSVLGHDLDWRVRSSVGLQIGEVLKAIGSESSRKLVLACLTDPNKDVRYTTAKALAGLKDPRAVASLAQALADDSEDVCIAAREALQAIGGHEAEAALAKGSTTGHC